MKLDTTSESELLHFLDILDININQIATKDNFKYKAKNGFYIVNLDNKFSHGTHWCAFFCIDRYVIYFDSFGLAPPMNIISFCNKRTIIYSADHIQHIDSNACGYYCIAFIKYFNDIPKQKLKTKRQLGFYLNNFLKPFDVQNQKKNEAILNKQIKPLLKEI